jgi:DNA excision repair protein ERCC-2
MHAHERPKPSSAGNGQEPEDELEHKLEHEHEQAQDEAPESEIELKLDPEAIFPYHYRSGQKDIINTIYSVFNQGSHLVMESGTGTGKTISALTPAICSAVNRKKRIIYLTRTNSQQAQVILELRRLKEKLLEEFEKLDLFLGVGLQGRQNLCPMVHVDPELASGTAEELSKLCSDRKRITWRLLKGEVVKADEKKRACKYYGNFYKFNKDEIKAWIKNKLPLPEELNEFCVKHELCAYEINKSLVKSSLLVCAPYIYVFNKFIRERLLEWMNTNSEDIILIIDEAHNLPDFARELSSAELSMYSLGKAREEAIEYGNPALDENVIITELCDHLQELLYQFQENYIIDEDGFVPPNDLEVELMSRFKCTSKALNKIINGLIAHGISIQESRQKAGRLPRSYIHSIGAFLLFWHGLESEKFTKLVRNGDNPRLEIFCLDPSVATAVCQEFAGSLHMSGTLRPLDEYRDSLGLPQNTDLAVFPSPFPKENLKLYYLPDVTTRYEELAQNKLLIPKLEDYVVSLSNATKKNTVVFFPSFSLLRRFLDDGLITRIKRETYEEARGMRQHELMELVNSFKLEKKGVLLSVIGGRISEGLDFPAEELEVAVLVGIPYPRPTAKHRALEHYYEVKFGKGWEYTVHAPTTRKLLQSIGRLIRNEDDKGFAIILDNRTKRFKNDLSGIKESWDPIKDLNDFFGKQVIS